MPSTPLRETNRRIIFGLKLKRRRLALGISPSELAERSGLSVSYLNEIEKGKKFPKEDKISRLAAALQFSEQELLSPHLDKNMAPLEALLRSNFLNELPMDRFGIELAKVVEIIAGAPAHVGAFISTLVELARNYELQEEHFYQAAMRSYQELYNNFFKDIEDAVLDFADSADIQLSKPVRSDRLVAALKNVFGVLVREDGLDAHTGLESLRSLFLPRSRELLLNSGLTSTERIFQVAKEIGFQRLDAKERSVTSGMLRVRSFEQVLNHYRASYFATALLMPKHLFIPDLNSFLARTDWDGNAFLDLQKSWRVTPEMLFQRLSNLLGSHFGLEDMFFQRMIYDTDKKEFTMDKELHLSRAQQPHRSGLGLHYCRRWLSLSLLDEMERMQSEGVYAGSMVGVQRSHYFGTNDTYLSISMARAGYPDSAKRSTMTMGILIDDTLRSKVAFCDDPSIANRTVNIVCETCAIEDCSQRAAPPSRLRAREKEKRIEEEVKKLLAGD
jgi:predicted transcriptional regulator/DNA-binding XRE family transcriptional regulator